VRAPASPGARRVAACPRGVRAVTRSACPRNSLNWSLRRYVRASSLRVWLLRQPLEMSGELAETATWVTGAAGRGDPFGSGRRRGPAMRKRVLSAARERTACHCLRINCLSIKLGGTVRDRAKADKWHFLPGKRRAFEEVFVATRLSFRETGTAPGTCDWLHSVTIRACRVILLNL
jgi:hypothetical protein